MPKLDGSGRAEFGCRRKGSHVREDHRVDADAALADGDRHLMAEHRHADRNRAACRREPDGVAEQVAEHLLQPTGVTADHGVDGRAAIEPKAGPLHFGSHGLARLVHGLLEAHRFRFDPQGPADDAGFVDQVVEELTLPQGVAPDDGEGIPHIGRQVAAGLEDLRPAEDGIQRTSQLVREGGEKLVAALRGLEGRGPETAQFVDGLLELPDTEWRRRTRPCRPCRRRRRPAGRPSPTVAQPQRAREEGNEFPRQPATPPSPRDASSGAKDTIMPAT